MPELTCIPPGTVREEARIDSRTVASDPGDPRAMTWDDGDSDGGLYDEDADLDDDEYDDDDEFFDDDDDAFDDDEEELVPEEDYDDE